MPETLIHRAKHAPGWQRWAAEQARLDDTDTDRLTRILGVFIDRYELPEAVGAIKAAGFHR
jgi:hypothetical protein